MLHAQLIRFFVRLQISPGLGMRWITGRQMFENTGCIKKR